MGEVNVHALLFADRVIVEEGTKKKNLIGVFSHFIFPRFPSNSPPWFIFLALDNVDEGKHVFAVNLTHGSGQVLLSASGRLNSMEAGGVAEIHLPIASIQFSQAGGYTVSIFFDGRQIASRNLPVIERKPEG